MIRGGLTYLLVILLTLSSSAQSLFFEDFETEPNGATNGTATGTPGGTWSAAYSGSVFYVQNNVFRINSSAGLWTSSNIDISGKGYAILSLDFGSVGLFGNNDFIRAYYVVDGGSPVMFGEFRPSLVAVEGQASAIVSGSTLQIIIQGQENSFLGVYLAFDNVMVTPADVLYSRKSGTWTDVTGGFDGSGMWSTERTGSPACGCVPLNDVVAVIQNGHTVTIPTSQTATGGSGTPNLAPGAVDVESGGVLQFNTSGVTLGIQEGLFRVRGGGTVNSSGAGVTGETIAFNGDVPAGTFTVDPAGTVTVENVSFNTNNTHFLNGGGSLNIQGDLRMNASGMSLTNNIASVIDVGRIHFVTGANNSSFTTTESINAGRLFFDGNNSSLTNSGTLMVQDIVVNNNNDDDNSITNTTSGVINLTSTGNSISAGSADLGIYNAGSVTQLGNFTGLVTGCDFVNQNGGTWRWQLNNNTIPTNFAVAMDCGTAGNTFYYDGTGNQNIGAITYQNLVLASGGNKSLSAALDVNGNLTIENATLAGGTNGMDIEGNVAINGTGVLDGTGNISVGGSWSAIDAASFTEGTRTVTFDGGSAATIANASGLETFSRMTINKSAAGNTVTMQSDVSVAQVLTLTRGRLFLEGNALTLSSNVVGALSGGSGNSFVVSETTDAPYGRIIRATANAAGNFVFPFGTASGNYVPYGFNKAATTSGGTVSVATYSTPANNLPYPATVGHVADGSGADQSAQVVNRFWMINTTGPASMNAAQSFGFVTATEASGVLNPKAAQRWNGVDGWGAKVGNSSANPFLLTDQQMAGSSIWVLVSNSITLPVEWLEFDARLKNHEVEVSWKTAMESNNDYFTVERAQNIEQFEPVAVISGKGNTTTTTSYSIVDPNPMYGVSYYRVKQTDFDGTVTHSGLRKVVYEGPEFASLSAYPNPSDGKMVTFSIRGLKEVDNVLIEIIDSKGVVVWSRPFTVRSTGYLEEAVSLDNLPSGLYIVRAGHTPYMTIKFIVK